jgi:hypothetical protein
MVTIQTRRNLVPAVPALGLAIHPALAGRVVGDLCGTPRCSQRERA